MRRFLGPAALVVLASTLALTPRPASGCAVAPPRNKAVAIASESAIIVWDEAEKMQHFIRRASFSTDAADFGFLVPTPTQPKLGEAEDEAFERLATLTAPKVETKPRPSSGGCGIGCALRPGSSPGAAAPEVEVLDKQRVAGHDAVVLAAKDGVALTDWLRRHGYEQSPALREWVQPYLDKGWVITAFKIARDEKEPRGVATKAARLSFKTEQPIFPYREPRQEVASGGEKGGRLLRIFFLSNKRVKGSLENEGGKWPGQTVWAGALKKTDREEVWGLLKLPGGKAPGAWWLTEFEDHSATRKGAGDLFFSPSGDQQPKERKPHVKYVSRPLPDGITYYALAACLGLPPLVRRWRRGGRAGTG